MGYSSSEIYDKIKNGAQDLDCDGHVQCPGYDIYTGYGLEDMNHSMELAYRDPAALSPEVRVIPNNGKAGVQRFSIMGSGLTPNGPIQICWKPQYGADQCKLDNANHHGAQGISIQIDPTQPMGTWTGYILDETTHIYTPGYQFVVTP